MAIFTCLMMFLVILASGVPQAKSDSPALTYWNEKLPNTPIPNSLRELIVPEKSVVNGGAVHPSGGKHGDILLYHHYGKTAVNGEAVQPSSGAVHPSGGKHGDILLYHHYGKTGGDNNAKNELLANPALSVFFLEKDLHVGTKRLVYLKGSNDTPEYFLPRHLSEKIPFSSDKLSVALASLNIPEGSDWASSMRETLDRCEVPKGKTEPSKYCATSLESMVDYSTSTLGTNHVNVLMTEVPKNFVTQQCTFTAVSNQSASNQAVVVCHSEAYAYAVYYCHEQTNIQSVKISLKADDGTSAQGVAVCHEDTSAWDPDHVSFKVLNVKPGGPAICHFLPEHHVVWAPAN